MDCGNKMQIKASQICFWDADKRDQLEVLHTEKAYPPRVKLTFELLGSQPTPLSLLFKFSGSTADMDMEIMLPLGNVPCRKYSEDTVYFHTCMNMFTLMQSHPSLRLLKLTVNNGNSY